MIKRAIIEMMDKTTDIKDNIQKLVKSKRISTKVKIKQTIIRLIQNIQFFNKDFRKFIFVILRNKIIFIN